MSPHSLPGSTLPHEVVYHIQQPRVPNPPKSPSITKFKLIHSIKSSSILRYTAIIQQKLSCKSNLEMFSFLMNNYTQIMLNLKVSREMKLSTEIRSSALPSVAIKNHNLLTLERKP
uniref:Uncharacterized protein n=1 Tax=Populus davidiana TaxID=266767 RepID=A0A6M2EJN1_9ROSI